MRTRVGEVYRYRRDGFDYWTVYEQRESSWFFSGSCVMEHSLGCEYRGAPGAFKNEAWERLV